MAVTRTLFRGLVQADTTVSTVLARMNAELSRENEAQVFVTAVIGCLDLSNGRLTYGNAGHPPPFRASAADRTVTTLEAPPGIAFGVLPDATYGEAALHLTPQDLVVVYTDGITEAIDARGRLFSEARLREVLVSKAGEAAHIALDGVLEAVDGFVGGTAQEDDITALAIRYRGSR
jgi:sigma-B regulation protein RsbU (phosphoserine phosphatase)